MSRPIKLWKGFHGPEVQILIEEAWRGESLLILYPPTVMETKVLSFLPSRPIEFVGEWNAQPTLNVESHGSAFPEEPVLGLFTTGTTGGHKLVLYSKENIQSALDDIRSFFDLSRIKKLFCYPQPFHTFGLTLGYVHQIEYGLQRVPLEGPYSRMMHDHWIEESSSDLLTLGTPTHFQDLMQASEGKEIRDTYSCIVGGARVERALWKNIQTQLKIESPSIGYGATEASPGVTHLPPGQEPLEDGELGVALPNVALDILPGEGLRFQGPNVCLAIIENQKIHFPDSHLIRDEIERREDGVLLHRGRNELVLNRGGEKFRLEEMERSVQSALNLEIVCVAVQEPRLGSELGVVLRKKETGHREAIYAHLKKKFLREFNSRYCIEVDEFPQSASAKLDRKACSQLFKK